MRTGAPSAALAALALLALLALLAASGGAAAQDPVTHWRTVAGKVLVHHVDEAKRAAAGVQPPAVPDPSAVVADAPGAALAFAGEARARAEEAVAAAPVPAVPPVPALPALPALPGVPGLPALPDAGAAADFAVRAVQYQATRAVKLFENLRR